MNINQIASSIYNDIWGGSLIPSSDTSALSIEQLEDEVVDVRSAVIKEYYLKNLIKKHELTHAINCIELDCQDQNKCPCSAASLNPKTALHFEIPQLETSLGGEAISFIGSTDRKVSFKVFYNLEALNYEADYQKYKRGHNKPIVYIERTPNANGMFDGWIFNAPFVKYISVIGIFRDPRQLESFSCCHDFDYTELGTISSDVKSRLLNSKLQLYRISNNPAKMA